MRAARHPAVTASHRTFSLLDRILVPIHREGWRFAGLFAIATLLL